MKQITMTLLVLSFFVLYTEKTKAAVRLQSSVIVDSPILFLGNIFDGLPSNKAEQRIGPAPEPGQRRTLRLSVIHKIARRYGIDWKPTLTTSPITIERASRRLTQSEIHTPLVNELARFGAKGDFALEIRARDLSAFVPLHGSFNTEIIGFGFDKKSERFFANMRITGSDFAPINTTVNGFARKIIEIPVLARSIRRGEPISDNDISWRRIPATQLRSDFITDLSALSGKESNRSLRKGKPIRLMDLRNRRLVKKGKPVTVTVQSSTMTLKTIGQALDHGSYGDLIRILNLRSKKTIMGIVVGLNDVRIPLEGKLKLAATQ